MTALLDTLTSFKKSPPETGHVPSDNGAVAKSADEWQRLIDEKLIEWGRHPEQFEDEDGYKAPSADNLVRATELAAYCKNQGVAPPLRMAPDGEGGIVFDWKSTNPLFHIIARIHPDGAMELLEFHDCDLVARKLIGPGTPA